MLYVKRSIPEDLQQPFPHPSLSIRYVLSATGHAHVAYTITNG